MRIVVTDGVDLYKEEWVFTLLLDSTPRLFFDSYTRRIRQTKRHGWKITKTYSRFDTRNNNASLSEVYPTKGIVDQAKDIAKVAIDDLSLRT